MRTWGYLRLSSTRLGCLLGSAALEVDGAGAVISHEEYHPYGTSAYRAVDRAVEVSAKRYRYTGKELDEETGLYDHGARYLAAWLGRWVSADPAGLVDGNCVYCYCAGNPIVFHDPQGTQKAPLEIRTSERPQNDVRIWAYLPGRKGVTIASNEADLRAAAAKARVPIYIYSPDAPGRRGQRKRRF